MKKISFLLLLVLSLFAVGSLLFWKEIPELETDSSSTFASPSEVFLEGEQVPVESVNSLEFFSSTRLSFSWQSEDAPDHYVLSLTDSVDASVEEHEVVGTETAFVAENLKAGTSYEAVLRLCLDDSCAEATETAPITLSTSEEYWQIAGEGNQFEKATVIAEDSNVLSYLLDYEEDGAEYPSDIRFYGTTGVMSAFGMGVSFGYQVDPEDLSLFELTSRPFVSCDSHQKTCLPGAMYIAAFQVLPLENKEKTMFCFEGYFVEDDANPNNSTTEIYCLDSDDGWAAIDFDQSGGKVCGDEADEYGEGGNCELEKVFGVEDGLEQARQFKVGFPKLDSWKWNQEDESFIVITGKDECGYTNDGLFYGEWVDGEWVLHRDGDNCPEPIVQNAHGPVIVHLGGTRYKLYYENYELSDNSALPGPQQPKPFLELYIDLSDPEQTWEPEEDARQVHFLWPDGTLLSPAEEAGLGDHMILVIDKDLDQQVMYMNLSGMDNVNDPGPSLGVGTAMLLN